MKTEFSKLDRSVLYRFRYYQRKPEIMPIKVLICASKIVSPSQIIITSILFYTISDTDTVAHLSRRFRISGHQRLSVILSAALNIYAKSSARTK